MRIAVGAAVLWVALWIGWAAPAAWAQVGARAIGGAFANPCTFNDSQGYSVPSAHVVGLCNGNEGASAATEASSSVSTGDLLVSELAHTTSYGANANAYAEIFDRLTFSVPGGGPGGLVTVHISFDLDGSMSGPQTLDPEDKLLRYRFIFTDANDFRPGHTLDVIDALLAPNGEPLVFASDVLISWPYNAEVLARLEGSPVYEGGLAYTSAIAMSVPTGVTWTSESGVFLAPEPSSAFGAGAALAALRARWRARVGRLRLS